MAGTDYLAFLRKLRRQNFPPSWQTVRKTASLLLREYRERHQRPTNGTAPTMPEQRRYLSSQPERVHDWIEAAETYPEKVSQKGNFLWQKPFDQNPGHPSFFHSLYPLVNLLEVMKLPPGGRILEVGCGPGWATEILVLLGYQVNALDPSQAMLDIARERVALAWKGRKFKGRPRLGLHRCTLEECSLPDEYFDGVLFFEALHHVVDEEVALKNAYRMLRWDGVIGVANDTRWYAGRTNVEAELEREMAEYGTLENPYSREYVEYLLATHGFTDATFYHQINGFIPEQLEYLQVREAAQFTSMDNNTFTASKRHPEGKTTLNYWADTRAEIAVRSSAYDKVSRRLTVGFEVKNVGETILLARRTDGTGQFAIGLTDRTDGFREARNRCPLDAPLKQGESRSLEFTFHLPQDAESGDWHLEGLVEGRFWFADRDISCPGVSF